MTGNPSGANGHTIYPMPRPVAVRKVLVDRLVAKMPSELFRQAIPALVADLTPHLRDEPLQRPPLARVRDVEVPEREIQILKLASQGMTNRRIGAALGITENTVKTYLRRILVRFAARDRTQAVAIAIRRGLIP